MQPEFVDSGGGLSHFRTSSGSAQGGKPVRTEGNACNGSSAGARALGSKQGLECDRSSEVQVAEKESRQRSGEVWELSIRVTLGLLVHLSNVGARR